MANIDAIRGKSTAASVKSSISGRSTAASASAIEKHNKARLELQKKQQETSFMNAVNSRKSQLSTAMGLARNRGDTKKHAQLKAELDFLKGIKSKADYELKVYKNNFVGKSWDEIKAEEGILNQNIRAYRTTNDKENLAKEIQKLEVLKSLTAGFKNEREYNNYIRPAITAIETENAIKKFESGQKLSLEERLLLTDNGAERYIGNDINKELQFMSPNNPKIKNLNQVDVAAIRGAIIEKRGAATTEKQRQENANIVKATTLFNEAAYGGIGAPKQMERADLYIRTGLSNYFEGFGTTIDVLLKGYTPEEVASEVDKPYAIASAALRNYFLHNGQNGNAIIQDITTNIAQNAIPILLWVAGGAAARAGLSGAGLSTTTTILGKTVEIPALVSQAVSTAAFAPSVFGNAYKEGAKLGVTDPSRLIWYSLAITAAECSLELILGSDKNPAGGVVSGKIISGLSKTINSVLGKVAARTVGSGTGEFVEESIQSLLSPILQKYILGVDVETVFDNPIPALKSALYDGFIGFVSGALISGATNVSQSLSESQMQRMGKVYKNTFSQIGVDIKDVATYLRETYDDKNLKTVADQVIEGDSSDLTIGELLSRAFSENEKSLDFVYGTIGQNILQSEEGLKTIIEAYEITESAGAIYPDEVTSLYESVIAKKDSQEIDNVSLGKFAFYVQAYSPRALVMGQLYDNIKLNNHSLATKKSNGVLQQNDNGGIINQNTSGGAADVREQGLLRDGGQRSGSEGSNTQVASGTLPQTAGGVPGIREKNGVITRGVETLRDIGDNRGVTLTAEQNEKLRDTSIKNDDGSPKVVCHFTDNMDFDVFGEGDIGFHFGSESQAAQHKENLRSKNQLKGEGRIIRAHLAIKNPIYVNTDIMVWEAAQTALWLQTEGIISKEQRFKIEELQLKSGGTYNTPAAIELRRILSEKGYDGIEYKNNDFFEGEGESYIAFYPEQVIIIDDGKGNTQAGSSESASIMPENEAQGGFEGETEIDTDDVENRAQDDVGEGEGDFELTEPDISEEKVDWVQQIGDEVAGYDRKTEGQRLLFKAAQKLGWKVGFANVYKKDSNGRAIRDENGQPQRVNARVNKVKKEIVFDYECKNPIKQLIFHELSHFLETNIEAYTDFANAVMKSIAFKNWVRVNGFNSVSDYNKAVREAYEGTEGFETEEEGEYSATFEMVADFVAYRLFKNEQKTLNRLAAELSPEHRNRLNELVHRVVNWAKTAFAGTKQEREIARLEAQWIKTYKKAEATWQENQTSGQQKNTDQNDGVRYSIKEIIGSSNKNYGVGVYLDSDRLANLSEQQRKDTVKKFVINNLAGEHFIAYDNNNSAVDIGIAKKNDTIRNKNGKKRNVLKELYNKYSGLQIKQEAIVLIDELITTAKYDVSENSNYAHDWLDNYGKNNWDYWKVFIQDKNKSVWEATLNIANTSNGEKILYDIGPINMVEGAIKSAPTTTNNSILNEEPTVKNNYTQNGEKYSISFKRMDAIDNYTEEQYNNFGWVTDNDIVSTAERETLFSRYADYKHNGDKYPTTRFGEAVIHSTECPDVIMYVKGEIESPDVTKVVRIKDDIADVKEALLRYEREGYSQPFKIIENYFGEWILDINYKRNYESFREVKARIERERSQGGNTDSGTVEDGARGLQQNSGTDRAGLKQSAFSMPEEEYSISVLEKKRSEIIPQENESVKNDAVDDLFDKYDRGEISRDELIESLAKQRKEKETPKTIANLTKADASTTPQHNRRNGVAKGNRESKTYGSLLKSDIFDETFKKEVESDDFIRKYQSVGNEETMRKAARELDEGGQKYVNLWWNIDAERASLIDTAVGFILMDRYQRIGDYESAVAAAEKVRQFGTASGRQVQIFSILGRLDPNTMIVYAQRELTKAFEVMIDGRTQKWIDKNAERFRLTEDEIEFIRRHILQAAHLPEGRDKAIRLAEVTSLLQDKIPPEKAQGLKALQRISLLLNPKTNIRNFVGNAGMVPVFIATDFFGSGIDKLVSKKTNVRTTGNFDIKSVKGFAKGVYETMDDFRRHINTRNQEMNRFEIGQGKSFDENHTGKMAKQLNDCAKVLNALDRFTSFCLELGDRPFYEMHYINSLNNQMKLNKVSEATPDMILIASLEALQRTWQDANKMVSAVGSLKGALNNINIDGYGLGDVLVKFTKTPANLTKAVFDFSPLGLVKSIAADGKAMRNALEKGTFEPVMQKKFVDSLSKGITGTLLYVLALGLSKAGLLSGGRDEDKDVANFEKYIQGIPEYSVKILGKWYSYEWMQPAGAIAASVADYMKTKEETPDSTLFDNIMLAIKAGGEILYNQSFMQSIQNLFTADNIIDGVSDSLLEEPSAFAPQIFSQITNTTDKYRRTAYEPNDSFKTALNNVKYKIPGLRQTLEKQVDVMGREIPNSQHSIFNAFFNPANTYTDTSNAVTDEIYSLYKKTGKASVIPKTAPNYVSVKNTKIKFSAKQKMDFQRTMGQTSADILENVFKSAGYKKLSDAEKIDVVENVYKFATAMAKSELEYDYETLSAMVGEKSNGEPYLSKKDYDKLSKKAKKEYAKEYFLTKGLLRISDKPEEVAKYLIKKATE